MSGGRTVTVDRPMRAVYVPRPGAAPIGPFVISPEGLREVQALIFPRWRRASASRRRWPASPIIRSRIASVLCHPMIRAVDPRGIREDIPPAIRAALRRHGARHLYSLHPAGRFPAYPPAATAGSAGADEHAAEPDANPPDAYANAGSRPEQQDVGPDTNAHAQLYADANTNLYADAQPDAGPQPDAHAGTQISAGPGPQQQSQCKQPEWREIADSLSGGACRLATGSHPFPRSPG